MCAQFVWTAKADSPLRASNASRLRFGGGSIDLTGLELRERNTEGALLKTGDHDHLARGVLLRCEAGDGNDLSEAQR